jgi:multidrug efflux pump subunit AcrB
MNRLGLSGRIAQAFIQSKLTPLIMVVVLFLGGVAILITPREEEPQIIVPMADVSIPFAGASAKEVEDLVVRPIERKITEIRRVEYVYSISRAGMAFFIVRFYVGEDVEKSLVDLYDKLMSNRDLFPPGASDFMLKPRDINDVPIVTLTLWSPRYDDYPLRRVADHLLEEVKKIPKTSGGFIVGGRQRQFRVRLDPGRMEAYGVTPTGLSSMIQAANRNLPSGKFQRDNREFRVETGGWIKSVEDLEQVMVGSRVGRPVFLRDVAEVKDGPEEPSHYVWFGAGPGAQDDVFRSNSGVDFRRDYPAVTVAVGKLPGANAVDVSRAVLRKVEELKGSLIPSDIHVTVTRDYGRTANEKANELLKHLLYAVLAVVIFLGGVLGVREAGVVALAIPLTLALTLFLSWMIGYTINRVTLFALIFSIGILVDDAIVVVENIYRHLRLEAKGHREGGILSAILAVDEVGNPTILATLTVIAALLPMAFISGLMGPYMRPIPVNASIAMFFSLAVAFVIVPWFCRICYQRLTPGEQDSRMEETLEESRIYQFYRWLLIPLIESPRKRILLLSGVGFLLLGSLSLFYFKLTVMKMLPYDNKSELQLLIDMPEGTPLEETARVTQALTAYVRTLPEVTDYQAYVGTSSPFNFNGLVRHYFLRSNAQEADIQINLLEKERRTSQSHEIAKRIRPGVQAIGQRFGADVKVVEVPPGPPVQSVLVAEVYGLNDDRRRHLARAIRKVFEETSGIVDIDDTTEADQVRYRLTVDTTKAGLAGVSSEEIVRTLEMALKGAAVGFAHIPGEKSPVAIDLRLPRPIRSGVEELGQIHLLNSSGGMIPISELIRVREEKAETAIYHKNLRSVSYVVGDVSGEEESPVYDILKISKRLRTLRLPEGRPIQEYYTAAPASEDGPAVKWDGEWQITYETFRDMGLAFGAALLLIYLLIVAQFQSFVIPLVIMAPIPLTLVGIVPGHWLTGSYFTATSMIGFIALAGIIVRNSILLVDFILAEQRDGRPLPEAVIRAGAVRTRPILLTAAALMVGAFVIIFDPIFQGLAISLLFGVLASTLLTLIVIPILYVMWGKRNGGKEQGLRAGSGRQ